LVYMVACNIIYRLSVILQIMFYTTFLEKQ